MCPNEKERRGTQAGDGRYSRHGMIGDLHHFEDTYLQSLRCGRNSIFLWAGETLHGRECRRLAYTRRGSSPQLHVSVLGGEEWCTSTLLVTFCEGSTSTKTGGGNSITALRVPPSPARLTPPNDSRPCFFVGSWSAP